MPKSPTHRARPYRSHKIRACDHCRKRKSRCTLDLPGKGCVMCRVSEVQCCYESNNLSEAPRKRARVSSLDDSSTEHGHCAFGSHRLELANKETPSIRINEEATVDRGSESAHIIGPILASDAQVVEKYMSPSSLTSSTSPAPYNVYSNDTSSPILYTKVSRRRPGFKSPVSPGAKQHDTLEQIVGPFANELVDLYFEKIHPSFPILEPSLIKHGVESQHTLICEIYAIALLYWDSSPILRKHPRPDMSYAWNLTVIALQDEFLSPGLSTIYSVLIDLMGRPSLWLTGNLINSARAVALAHSLGLNRNPRKWRMSKQDQNVRIRLWWGIVIHDRWAGFAHGVPPSITRTNYDTPFPTLDDLKMTGILPGQYKSAEVFIALCRLSEILGDILPFIYDLQMNPQKNTAKGLRKAEVDLDQWEDGLPEWFDVATRKPLKPAVPGSSSLQLGFLAVKLLIRRIRLHDATQSPSQIEQLKYYQAECRKGAMEIVDFVLALESEHFQEFWLPYSGYHLNSTAILLLRCAIETDDVKVKETCLSSMKLFLRYLEKASKEENWDIADICLNHCKPTMLKLTGPALSVDDGAADARPDTYLMQDMNSIENDLFGTPWLADGMLEGFEFEMSMWDGYESALELV